MAFGSHSDDTTMQKSHRTTFRTTSQNWMLSTAVGAWLGKNWKPKSVYHITADYTWGHTARTSMNRALAKYGCKEIGNDFTPLGTKDFSANLIKARGLKPDLLSCNCYGADQVNLVKQFKEFGLAKDIHLCGPLSGSPMMKGVGAAADGVWGLSWDCTVDTRAARNCGLPCGSVLEPINPLNGTRPIVTIWVISPTSSFLRPSPGPNLQI